MSIQLELCAQCHHNKQELSAHISAYKLGVVVPTHQYINVIQTVITMMKSYLVLVPVKLKPLVAVGAAPKPVKPAKADGLLVTGLSAAVSSFTTSTLGGAKTGIRC